MGKNYYLFKWTAFLFLVVSLLCSCEKERDKYYDEPDWLRGNAWEVLEQDGDYSIFLRGIEITGYKDMVNGKGIITVLAPTDEAFRAYFADHGISSIEEMEKDDVIALIGFHLVYYSYSKEMFANYRPEGANAEIDYNAGIYYKFRTRSQDPYTYMVDESLEWKPLRKIYHRERFVPIFSTYLFRTYGIDDKTNYEYFYPDTEWPDQDGIVFNISNAQVDEYEIITNNGYLYKIDQVLEPLETMYDIIVQEDNYSEFVELYDKFLEIEYDDDLTSSYGQSALDSIFVLAHGGGLPNISSEWAVSDYASLATLASYTSMVLAPNNNAINNFFTQNWYVGGYPTLDDVDILPINLFLKGHAYANVDFILFPEVVESGLLSSDYTGIIEFDTQSAQLHKIASNGVLYGLNEVIESYYFKGAFRPVYTFEKFRYFMYFINRGTASSMLALASTNGITLFAPNNDIFTYGPGYDGYTFKWNGNATSIDDEPLVYIDVEGQEASLLASWVNDIMNNQVSTGVISQGGNQKIYKTFNSFEYLLMDEDAELIFSSALFNTGDDYDAPKYQKAENQGGMGTETYELMLNDSRSGSILGKEKTTLLAAFSGDLPRRYGESGSPYQSFFSLITNTDFLLTSPTFDFTLLSRTVIFAPTEEAIQRGYADGTIAMSPIQDGDDSETIAAKREYFSNYLQRYFINSYSSGSLAVDYPFPGAVGSNQQLVTYKRRADGRTYHTFTLIDNGNNLQIMDEKGNTVNVVSVFPNIYINGAAYLIDGLLEVDE
ncbi:MAG: fasciclin domain-containing protein [Rikenellaceae bacterium]|nr:fasciclin domain-containing protein [Rikenellaceae bacterium]